MPLLFVARCTHQAVRQGHQQPIGGAKSGWRRNARALRDDGKTKQNALIVPPKAARFSRKDASKGFESDECNTMDTDLYVE